MTITEELMYDFDFRKPHLLLGGRIGIIERVKRLVLLNETTITVDCGSFFVSFYGENLSMASMYDSRLQIAGEINRIEIYRRKNQYDE